MVNSLILKNFTVLSSDELRLVLDWRNTERVRRMMSNPEKISWDNHIAYITSLSDRVDCCYYLVYVGERPIGVIDLTEIAADGSYANPGLYTGEDSPLGTGLLLEYSVFLTIFDRFGLREARSLVKKEQAEYSNSLVRIFNAVKIGETEDSFKMLLTDKNWSAVKSGLRTRLFRRFALNRVVWREKDGDIPEDEEAGS